ncbi:MAG: CHAD domain-containing protein [Solirubrobacterales bacterium]|nr:CHAD domain-containing protein [Solirubrobacterales bacterium]HMT04743.1 CHAD domain-containing protein [Solirubrobacterales bacterium]
MSIEIPDPRFRLAASQVLDERSTQITVLSRGVLDVTDTNPASQLWQASRRLRAAMEIFRPCLSRNDYRAGRGEARRIGRVVGARRDADVMIASWEEIGAEMSPAEADGISRLVDQLRRQQAAANRELAQVVHGRRIQAFRVTFEEIADAAVGTEAADRADEYRPVEALPPETVALVLKRLDRLRASAPKGVETGEVEDLRKMGIGAERLRYALELTGDALGTQAHTARRAARGLQEILGQIRDCGISVPPGRELTSELEGEDVRTMVERSRGNRELDPVLVQAAPNRAAYRGLELGIIHLVAKQKLLHERLKRLWLEQSRQGVWVALETSLKVES